MYAGPNLSGAYFAIGEVFFEIMTVFLSFLKI